MPPAKRSARKRAPAKPKHLPIRSTFELLVESLGELSPHQVAVAELGRHIADRIDADGPRNAALVKNYADLLGELAEGVDDDDGADPIGDVLTRILNSSPSGAAEQR